MKFKLLSLPLGLSPSMFQASKLARFFFTLCLISLPLQWNSFVSQVEWGRGFLNPYTSTFFSVTEGLLLLSGIFFIVQRRRRLHVLNTGHSSYFFILLLVTALGLYTTFLNGSGNHTFYFFLLVKGLELILLYLLLVNEVLSTQEIIRIFVYTLCGEAILAIFQVVFQSDLGLQILGEPVLSSQGIHLARFNFLGESILRAYGTLPHPNVLGGFLVTSILFTFLLKPLFRHEWTVLFTIQLLGLFATFSRSAAVGLTLGLLLLGMWYFHSLREKKGSPLLLFLTGLFVVELFSLVFLRGLHFFSDTALSSRIQGATLAWDLFLHYPFGVGFSHFTLMMDYLTEAPLMSWEYQPVHNVFLLALVEMGIFGFIAAALVVFFCFSRLYKKRHAFLSHRKQLRRQVFFAVLLALTLIGFFDHYLLSLEQGRLLVLLLFALSSRFANQDLPVYAIRKEGNLSTGPLALK